MLEILLMLAAEPAAQAASTGAPATAQSGDLTVSQGTVMTWNSSVGPGGEVQVVVENGGSEADRVMSVSTPAGSVTNIVLRRVAEQSQVAEEGDRAVRPGRTRVFAVLAGSASGESRPVPTTITVVFEKAGEVTIQATPASPPPAPPRR